MPRAGLTDASGNTTSWTYDNLGRVVSNTNELGKTVTYEYDALGNLTEMVDRLGRIIDYTYDNLSRLITETWLAPNGTTVKNTIDYIYDAWGRLDIVEGDYSKYDYDYDNLNRVTSVDNNGNATGVPRTVLTNTYDLLGRRTSLAAGDPGGLVDFINTYSYDAAGRMTQVTQAGQPGGRTVAEKRVDLAYDNLGRIDTIARFEDLAGSEHVATSDYTFDLVGRLISLAHTAGAVSLASYSYTYDKLNRLTQATSVDGTKNYNYDAIGQLTGVTGAASESYAYDATGNRTGGTVIGTNNRLLDDGTYTYLYDDAGNRVRRTDKVTGDYIVYEWDHRNRLTGVLFYNSTSTLQEAVYYRYDAFDRLIGRMHDADGLAGFEESEYYVYDSAPGKGGLDDVVLSYDENGNVIHRYLHGPAVDQVFADESFVDGVLWALSDRQGTVRDWADYDAGTNSTSVYNHVEFDSFGQIVSQTNGNHEVTVGYTGRYTDPTTGLQWNRGRWYDPKVGRWLSEDPIGFGGWDVNLVRYVGNSATNAVDPSGLELLIAARDLDFDIPSPGAHQFFIWIPEDREAARELLSECGMTSGGKPLKLVHLGNRDIGITWAAHKRNGKLKVVFNESADIKAAQEYNDPDDYAAFWAPDYSVEAAEIALPSGMSESEYVDAMLEAIRNYVINSSNDPITYGAFSNNCNKWAQSLLDAVGGKAPEEFFGWDANHSARFDESRFRDVMAH